MFKRFRWQSKPKEMTKGKAIILAKYGQGMAG